MIVNIGMEVCANGALLLVHKWLGNIYRPLSLNGICIARMTPLTRRIRVEERHTNGWRWEEGLLLDSAS